MSATTVDHHISCVSHHCGPSHQLCQSPLWTITSAVSATTVDPQLCQPPLWTINCVSHHCGPSTVSATTVDHHISCVNHHCGPSHQLWQSPLWTITSFVAVTTVDHHIICGSHHCGPSHQLCQPPLWTISCVSHHCEPSAVSATIVDHLKYRPLAAVTHQVTSLAHALK